MYAISAGMAAKSPAAVVIKASAIPGATARRLAVSRVAQSGEGVHHAPHRAEESDEWRYRSDRRQPGHSALEPPHLVSRGHLHLDAHRAGVLHLAAARICPIQLRPQFRVTRVVNRDQRSAAGPCAQRSRIGQRAAGPEHLQKTVGLAINPAQLNRFLKDDRPGKDGKEYQDSEDNARHTARLLQ